MSIKKRSVKKAATKKKAASPKRVVKKKSVARRKSPHPHVSARERYEMIATMAYYRAEKRNFDQGHDYSDWLECEAIVDQMLAK